PSHEGDQVSTRGHEVDDTRTPGRTVDEKSLQDPSPSPHPSREMLRVLGVAEDEPKFQALFADRRRFDRTRISVQKDGPRILPERDEVTRGIARAEKSLAEAQMALRAAPNDRFEDSRDRAPLLNAQQAASDALRQLKTRTEDISIADVKRLSDVYESNSSLAMTFSSPAGKVSRGQAAVAVSQSQAVVGSVDCISRRAANSATHLTVTVTLHEKSGVPVHGAKVYAVSTWVWEGRKHLANEAEFSKKKAQSEFRRKTTPADALLPRTEPLRIWAERDGRELARSKDLIFCSPDNGDSVGLTVGDLPG
ncbi:MAG: hypothetical protein ABI612_25025, partial [Betaproteobacteria bacterium]